MVTARQALVANARMYDVAPVVEQAWSDLFRWTFEQAGVPLQVVRYPPPLPLEDLWARDDLGCVFMCGWPYTMAEPRPCLVAAPVPSPTRYEERPVYFTDFIVRRESPFFRLEDTFGGRIGWTVDHSNSGFNAVRHHLMRYRRRDRPTLYEASIGPLIHPAKVIEHVLAGTIDVGPLDSYFHDLLAAHEPDAVAGLRVVETTEPAPIPPLVASDGTGPATAGRLRRALEAAHAAPEMAPVLRTLLLRRFVAIEEASYEPIRQWAKAAANQGYVMPA